MSAKISDNTKAVVDVCAARFWVVGDVHGMLWHLRDLLDKIHDYEHEHDDNDDYKIIFVGDWADRGSMSLQTLSFAVENVNNGEELYYSTLGNHDSKLWRALCGMKVKPNHGLADTLDVVHTLPEDELPQLTAWLSRLPLTIRMHTTLPIEGLSTGVVTHAAFHPNFYAYDNRWSLKSTAAYSIFGPVRGVSPEGKPDRIEWETTYADPRYMPFYGHRIVGDQPKIINGTIGLDTGCFESGVLTAVSYPDLRVLQSRLRLDLYK